jgi:putative Holliday junction resolvase
LTDILLKEAIECIVIGLPRTLKDTESEQTKKVKAMAQQLKDHFKSVTWVLWDERLTSKQAASLKRTKTKEEKIQSHAIAAALILSNYLEYRSIHKT